MGNVRQIFSENHDKWLPDEAYLWRYVPLRTLFLYLSGNVFIPSVEKLRRSDPFEGEFFFDTVWFNSTMRERYGSDVKQIDEWLYKERCAEWERKSINLNKNYVNYAAAIFEKRY